MKTVTLLATTAVLLGPSLSFAAPAAAANAMKPLRPVSACLDTSRVTTWYAPTDRSLVVQAGPRHYRIDLKSACPRLGVGPDARLVPSGTSGLDHRMCGDFGEKVVTVDGLPCAVKSVTPIDAATFKAAEKQAIDARHAGHDHHD